MNKKIIEVVDTQNDYFERAILFVRENRQGRDEAEIQQNADAFLQEAGQRNWRRVLYARPLLEAAKLVAAAGAGVVATLALTGGFPF